MDDLPNRPLLTPEAARATPLRTLLDRIDRFQRLHPGMSISAPYVNRSGKWEVCDGKGTALWDNGFRMMDDLESRYR